MCPRVRRTWHPDDVLRMGVLRAYRFQMDSDENPAGKLSRVRPLMWVAAVAFLAFFVASRGISRLVSRARR